MKRNWVIPFIFLITIAIIGIFFQAPKPEITGGPINTGDVAWMLTATGLVLLMTPGLSFFYGGMVRKKNVVSTMLQIFVAMDVICILWIVVVFCIAFCVRCYVHLGNPVATI